MTINLIFTSVLIIAIYHGIMLYIHTKERLVILCLCILTGSLLLELQRINTGGYLLNWRDFYRRVRDIFWVGMTMFFFKCIYEVKYHGKPVMPKRHHKVLPK